MAKKKSDLDKALDHLENLLWPLCMGGGCVPNQGTIDKARKFYRKIRPEKEATMPNGKTGGRITKEDYLRMTVGVGMISYSHPRLPEGILKDISA